MKTRIDSSEQQRYAVTLHHHERGEIGEGELCFGGNRATRVDFAISRKIALTDGERIELIKAVTDSGRTYTLCSCKSYGIRLYADYVIEADIVTPEFDQIVVRYWEASEWFLRGQHVTGQVGDKLTWEGKSAPLSVAIAISEEQFTLTSEYIGSAETAGEDLVVHEHVEFTFTATATKFNLSELKSKPHELSCLLSILIGYPVTTMTVHVGSDSGRFAVVHFPGFAHLERESDTGFWIKWFIQKRKIEDRWQSIFDAYYNSAYRKVVWVRLAGMQRYDGFWEYKALGYISLLDQYLSIWAENASLQPIASSPTKKFGKFRTELKDVAVPQLGIAVIDKIVQLVEQTFFGGPKKPTFSDKYKAAIAVADQDVRKIINLSEDDFKFIKDVRDRIAHGDAPGIEGDDYQRVASAIGKITLLLTYWAFLDIGLTKQDFIQCLGSTHNPLRFSCVLDDIHLARLTGSAEFFSVTAAKFDELSKIGIRLHACFERDASGELNFSEKYTKMYKDWESSPSRRLGILKPSEIFGVDDSAAKCVGHSYFEYGEKQLEAFQIWILI